MTLVVVIGYRMLSDNARTTAIVLGSVKEIADQEVEKIRVKREKKAAARARLLTEEVAN